MRTYAEYLNTMTVKTLNVIAKSLSLKGYSKLRKAALVELVARQIGMDEAAAHKDNTVKIMKGQTEDALCEHGLLKGFGRCKVPNCPAAPQIEFSTPVKAPEIVAKPAKVATPTRTLNRYASVATDDLVAAYQNYRATFRNARGITQVKIGNTLRTMSAELRSRKVAIREM